MEKITFVGENDTLDLYVIETTRLGAVDYLLATDVETGDGNCYILKDMSKDGEAESNYEMVTDDHELDYLVNVFAELVDDVDIEF